MHYKLATDRKSAPAVARVCPQGDAWVAPAVHRDLANRKSTSYGKFRTSRFDDATVSVTRPMPNVTAVGLRDGLTEVSAVSTRFVP